MNLSLNKLPWYGQVGAFVALSAAGVGVFWYLYAQPTQAGIAERRAKLEALQAENVKARQTTSRLPEFRREVAGLESQLERLKSVLPEERDVAELLRRVQAMATESNLTIQGFTPRAIVTRDLHAEWPIGLELEGSYHDLGLFLDRISKFPRIINVNAINIQARQAKNGAGPATITAQTTATTFVLIEPAPVPAAANGRSGRAGGRGRGAAPGRG